MQKLTYFLFKLKFQIAGNHTFIWSICKLNVEIFDHKRILVNKLRNINFCLKSNRRRRRLAIAQQFKLNYFLKIFLLFSVIVKRQWNNKKTLNISLVSCKTKWNNLREIQFVLSDNLQLNRVTLKFTLNTLNNKLVSLYLQITLDILTGQLLKHFIIKFIKLLNSLVFL